MSLQPLNGSQRQLAFGPLEFVHAPIPGNPENISLKGTWAKDNIVIVNVPELVGISGAGKGNIQIHRKAADSIRFLFNELSQLGLTDLIHTWGGSFVPRLVRGSSTALSNHAFGTAFDINMEWNGLGKKPLPEGSFGSVVPIVPIAEKHGWFWGGHYTSRLDGMHFEYVNG